MYVVEQQGHVLKVHVKENAPSSSEGAPPRGAVTSFSRKSRKRLLELFNRLEIAGRRTTFLTLTTAQPLPAFQATTAFRKFKERLRRRFPDVSFVWRKELQKRGAWHYHLILFDFPYIPQAQLQRVWEQCTGEQRSIVDVRLVTTHKELMSYVSKVVAYVSKDDDAPSLDTCPYLHAEDARSTGRWWGVHNKEKLPFAERRWATCYDWQSLEYLKWWMHALSKRTTPPGAGGGTLFHDEARAMFEHYLNLIGNVREQTSRESLRWGRCKHGLTTLNDREALERGWDTRWGSRSFCPRWDWKVRRRLRFAHVHVPVPPVARHEDLVVEIDNA